MYVCSNTSFFSKYASITFSTFLQNTQVYIGRKATKYAHESCHKKGGIAPAFKSVMLFCPLSACILALLQFSSCDELAFSIVNLHACLVVVLGTLLAACVGVGRLLACELRLILGSFLG